MRGAWLMLGKELRVLVRDRRLFLGVTVVSLFAMPALMGLLGNIDRVGGGAVRPVPVLVTAPDSVLWGVLAGHPSFELYGRRAAAEAAGRYLEVRRQGDVYRILYDGSQERLVDRSRVLRDALEAERERGFEAALARRGLSRDELTPFRVERVDTTGGAGRSVRVLGTLIPYLVVLLLVGNAIRAVYIAVGEKEKNTLASLLVSTAPRYAIVLGKSLAIVLFAIYASVLLIAGLLGFAKLGFSLDSGASGMRLSLSVGQAAQLVASVVALALFVSGVIMLLGTFARSQREAGVYTAPLIFVAIALAVFSLSSSQFGAGLYAVPILGNGLAMKDAFLGSTVGTKLFLSLAGDVLAFIATLAVCVWMYHREGVLFRR